LGGTNGSASVSATGGTPPFTYSWTTSPPQTGNLASGLTVGTYTCIVTDAGGCQQSKTVAVTQTIVNQPSIFVSSNGTNVCLGNTVAIAASGVNSFTWSNGSNLQLITVSPLTNTTYTVGGYNSSNCLLTGSISINVNPLPTVTITGLPPSLCINSPNVSYTYGPPGGNLSAPGFTPGIFEPAVAGIGAVSIAYSYTDTNGCSASSSSSTQVNPLPSVSMALSTGSFCTNSPIYNLVSSASPSGGSFSGAGVNNSNFSPSSAGTGTSVITYSYTDANNCSNTGTAAAIVFSLAAPTLSVSRNNVCTTAPNIQVIANPAGGTYSGAVNTAGLFSPSQAGVGTFTVSYTISSGVCTVASAITMTVINCTGLTEYQNNLFTVYPNPNKGSFTIQSPLAIEISIINQLGQEVYKGFSNPGVQLIQPDHLVSGIYFIKAVSGNQSSILKIVVRD
jgi:hypothetical protein